MTVTPSFMIIGAQKCGTSWLWSMLDQHPGTDLPPQKEIFFFSAAEKYKKGIEWYERKFRRLDPRKVTGEASTDYLYDRVLYKNLYVAHELPPIPELIVSHYPNIRVLVLLRDPVRRAISAHYHHLRLGRYSPSLSIREAARLYPYVRILERGHYLKYLNTWCSYLQRERIKCFIYEEDVLLNPKQAITSAYSFLELSTDFVPGSYNQPRNKGWNWTNIVLGHRLGAWYLFVYRILAKTPLRRIYDRINLIDNPGVDKDDIEFLRKLYLPEKAQLSAFLGRKLDCWSYQ